MSTSIKRRRGTAAEHELFTGALSEITVVTDDNTLRVHDGVTVGGHGPDKSRILALGTEVKRALDERAGDMVDVKDFIGTAGEQLTSAVQHGNPVRVTESATFNLTLSQAAIVLAGIDRVNFMLPCEVNITEAGEVGLSTRLLLSNPTFQNLILSGIDSGSIDATAVSETGTALVHNVTFTVTDSSATAVGDYVIVSNATGSGYVKVVEGCWKVTAKTPTTVTVNNTVNFAWPTMNLGTALLWPIKTVLRFPEDVTGVAITTVVHTIKNLVIAGAFDIATGTPSDSPTDGLQIGTSPNTEVTGLNESEQTNVGALYAARVGVVEFEGNGVQSLGVMYAVLFSACSNGWRGIQAGRNGFAGVKSSSASGNGASGYEAEEGGFVLCQNSVSAGNWQQGYYTIGGGNMANGGGFAIGNQTHGIESKNFSFIDSDNVTCELNAIEGVTVTSAQVVVGAGAVVQNNGGNDVSVLEGGTVNANGATTIGTVVIDEDSRALYIQPDGTVLVPEQLVLAHSGGARIQQSVSSLGDMNWSFDPANTGSYTAVMRMKSNGTFHPLQAGVVLGRSTDYFSGTFTETLWLKSPDGTPWQVNVDNSGTLVVTT